MTTHQPLIPSIVVDGARQALEFYERALGAQVLKCFTMPDDTIAHAEVVIANTLVYVLDPLPALKLDAPSRLGARTGSFTIYVDDIHGAFQTAHNAGATVVQTPEVSFTGDHYGILECPFGHRWILTQKVADVSDEDIQSGVENWSKAVSDKKRSKTSEFRT